jgi:uncharacterized RDD family membrane protein YckC
MTQPGEPVAHPQQPVPTQGYGPPAGRPGYPPPGYGPPGYPPPGYGPAGYGPPGQSPPGYGPPSRAVPGYPPGPARPVAPNGLPLADFGDRLLAYLIDSAIIGGIALVFAVPAAIVMLGLANGAVEMRADGTASNGSASFVLLVLVIQGFWLLVILAGTYLYAVEMMYRTGQTLGKRAMKLRVVCLDPAAPLTRGVAAKRWSINYLVTGIVPFVGWLNGLWQLWDKPYRQCLHDKVARTVVVKLPA